MPATSEFQIFVAIGACATRIRLKKNCLIAIAMIHCDNRAAAAIAMGIFATGVAVSGLLIATHDRLFSGDIHLQPMCLCKSALICDFSLAGSTQGNGKDGGSHSVRLTIASLCACHFYSSAMAAARRRRATLARSVAGTSARRRCPCTRRF